MSESVEVRGGPTEMDSFEQLVRRVAREYGPSHSATEASVTDRIPDDVPAVQADRATTVSEPTIWASITLTTSDTCIAVCIAVAKLAEFMNTLGTAAFNAKHVDVQIYLQRRRGRRAHEKIEIWGAIIDIDRPSDDALGTLLSAGVPTPTCWWCTRNGSKGAWAFSRSVDAETFLMIAQELAVAVPGADPGSWLAPQAQHLPVGWKSTTDGVLKVAMPASQSNAVPFDVGAYTPTLPQRVARALVGATRLTAEERRQVETWLAERDLDAPDTPGRALYDSCPACDKHDSRCCYVNRRDDESIDVACVGGHGGEGKKFWNEIALHREATGARLASTEVDAIADIPFTWAGLQFVRSQLSVALAEDEFSKAIIEAGCDVWQRAKAARALGTLHEKAASRGLSLINGTLDTVIDINRRRTGAVEPCG